MTGMTPPPRPSREGVNLGNSYRQTMTTSEMNGDTHFSMDNRSRSQMPRPTDAAAPAPSIALHSMPSERQTNISTDEKLPERSLSPTSRQQQPANKPMVSPQQPQQTLSVTENNSFQEEKAALIRELKARDMTIAEMKKKEQWWRTEVSIARALRAAKGETFDDQAEADEAMLMSFEGPEDDKLKLFDQLVALKAELRRVKQSIAHQAQPLSQKLEQADRMRMAALQEAAYFKSKYMAVKAGDHHELARIETERAADLERRLAAALSENEANSRTLQQLQRRAQHDHASRLAAEERAKEAHERAQEAQEAHQRALEELAHVHERAIKAEAQAREGALQIAELTTQLAQALSSESSSKDLSEAHITISRLEASNLRARNEVASLKHRLAENMDDIARLRTLLSEREEALKEATRRLEDSEIQLGMMREALSRKAMVTPSSNNGSSTASPATTMMNGF